MKIGLKKPTLLGLGDNPPSRNATPLELFFDLAFVVAMAHLVSLLEGNLTYVNLLYVILKYVALFIFWNSITMYNQYFEDNTIIHRFIIFFSMIPILILSIDDSDLMLKALYVYTFSFIISRLYIMIIWFWATHKDENEYLSSLVSIYNRKNIYSILISAISFVFLIFNFLGIWIIFWVLALCIEIVYPIIKIKKLNSNIDLNDPTIPVFDRKLQMERSTLFTILILGEGLVGTSKFMNEVFVGHLEFLYFAFILFVITFMLLWIYMDYYSSYTVKLDYFLNLNYLNIFQTLGAFCIIAGCVTLFESKEHISQVIIAIGMILFSITNIIMNKHRGEFIFEKYEYTDIEYDNNRNIDFKVVKNSFYINILISIFLIFFRINIYVVPIIVTAVLLLNICLLIKSWFKYIDK